MERLLKEHIDEQEFERYREDNPQISLVPFGEYLDAWGEGALQARISYLESLLAAGFMLATDDTAEAVFTANPPTERLVYRNPLGVPHHHAASGSASAQQLPGAARSPADRTP